MSKEVKCGDVPPLNKNEGCNALLVASENTLAVSEDFSQALFNGQLFDVESSSLDGDVLTIKLDGLLGELQLNDNDAIALYKKSKK